MTEYSPTSRDRLLWLAQAHALIKIWNSVEEISFKSYCDLIALEAIRDALVTRIFSALHRSDAKITSGSGATDSFFRALNKVIASAEKFLFIIDPDMDDTVLDHYLNSRQAGVSVRLLLNQYPKKVKPAVVKYIQQFGSMLEARKSKAVHDRVVYIDSFVCWVVGQSLKDVAKSKPAYLVPLPPDIVSAKLQNHEQIWKEAAAI